MNATGLAVALALSAGIAHCIFRIRRHGSISVNGVFVVTVAGFALPTGVELIRAAFLNDVASLPHEWPEYVTAAGVVAIGLSLQYLIRSFRSVVAKLPDTGPDQPRN